jgi:serine protease Do
MGKLKQQIFELKEVKDDLEQEVKSSQSKRWKSYVLLFAAAMVLVLIGIWLFGMLPGPQRNPGNNKLLNPSDTNSSNILFNVGDTKVQNPVVVIAQTVTPAVVGVTNTKKDRLLSRTGEEMTGSGVIFDSSNGFIVTNNHVVQGASRIIVTLADGRELPAELVGRDPQTDLAVLRIQAPNLVAANFGDSEQVNVGETAVAIGNPLGMKFARSVTAGVISGLNRQLTTEEGNIYQLIQTDAAINPGNSGGALVNDRGEIIGINSVKISIPGFEGMGFAIPINQVKTVINSLVQDKQVVRPALGVQLRGEVTADSAAYYQLPVDYGVVIEVRRSGPADKAGLLDMDIIIAVNEQAITTAAELQAIIFQHQVGDTVQIKVIRQKGASAEKQYEELVMPVTLGLLTAAKK